MKKYIGLFISISGAAVAIPQILNFIIVLAYGGWINQIPFADDVTHWLGIFYGSLLIPTYKEYYELGIWGFGLILAGLLGVKLGYNFYKNGGTTKKLLLLEFFVLAVLSGIIFKFGLSSKFINMYVSGLLPPVLAIIFLWKIRKS